MPRMTDRFLAEGEEGIGRRAPRKVPVARIRLPVIQLIDVMFVLLMFFILCGHIRVPEGLLPSNLPELGLGGTGSTVLTVRASPIKIALYAVGAENEGVRVQAEDGGLELATSDELYQYLMNVRNSVGADAPIIIRPTGNVRWEHVVNAFNQAIRASFKTVGFAPAGT